MAISRKSASVVSTCRVARKREFRLPVLSTRVPRSSSLTMSSLPVSYMHRECTVR